MAVALFLLIVLCNSTAISLGSDQIHASGRIEYRLGSGTLSGQLLAEAFEAYVSNRTYRIVHYPDSRMDPLISRIEVDYDGKVCRRVKYLVQREHSRLNEDAAVFVGDGPEPPYGDPVASFVWLALCASGTYRDSTNTNVRPLTFLGPAYEKADIRLTALVRLAGNGSERVESRTDIHPAFQFSWAQNRLLKRQLAHSYTNLSFRITAWENHISQKLPKRAEFALYSYSESESAPHLDFSAVLSVTNYAQLNDPALVAEMPGRIKVHDGRFAEFGFAETVTYRQTNGKILTVADLKKTPAFRNTADHARSQVNFTTKRMVFLMIFAGLALGPVILLLKWQRDRKNA